MKDKDENKKSENHKTNIIMLAVIITIIVLHITPKLALRTHIFMMGHPIIAVTTEIIEDPIHKNLTTANRKFYSVTKAPVEKETDTDLRHYEIKRFGFIYLASYYGNG